MVAQLCSDFDSNYKEVNKQLDRMGYNIGMRLVEDFFAKSGVQRCVSLRDTAETISKVSVAFCPVICARSEYLKPVAGFVNNLQLSQRLKPLTDRLQDVFKHHSKCHQLVK